MGVVKIASPNHRSPLYPRRSAVKPIHTANATQSKLGMMIKSGLRLSIKGSTRRSWRSLFSHRGSVNQVGHRLTFVNAKRRGA